MVMLSRYNLAAATTKKQVRTPRVPVRRRGEPWRRLPLSPLLSWLRGFWCICSARLLVFSGQTSYLRSLFCDVEEWNTSLQVITGYLTLLQITHHWKRGNHFCFDRGLIRVAKADLARPVIRELHNIVIALLVPAVTVLGSHRATRFRPRVCMTNLGTSFWRLRRLVRDLWQGIIAAVQTLAFGSDGVAPCIVSARFASRLFFSHIVSFYGSFIAS